MDWTSEPAITMFHRTTRTLASSIKASHSAAVVLLVCLSLSSLIVLSMDIKVQLRLLDAVNVSGAESLELRLTRHLVENRISEIPLETQERLFRRMSELHLDSAETTAANDALHKSREIHQRILALPAQPCDECNSTLVPVLYGFDAGTDPRVTSGQAVDGGCVLMYTHEHWSCPSCEDKSQ